ncbi:MAG: class I SAM-dependent methyltransferase [Saprospiraceae bacterium]|nr:class I SAM-dependent methyltransferase [Saprospiraceae bacterium]
MHTILDFYARTHTPYLHALGREGTGYLLQQMAPKPGSRLLEIGFGTGQTLLELTCRFDGVDVFGLEKSAEMLRVAQKRFAFSGVSAERLQVMPANVPFPFPPHFFDAVYCESVLAILPDADLVKIWQQIRLVLRPGGRLFFNESLWRDGVSLAKMAKINEKCMEVFGIPQATATWPYPSDWKYLAEQQGFEVLSVVPMEGIRASLPFQADSRLFRSRIFTLAGKSSMLFSASLWKKQKLLRQLFQQFATKEPYLEGVFFCCRKKD